MRHMFAPVDEWMAAFTPPFSPGLRRLLESLYGTDTAVWNERCQLLRQALGAYRERFGAGPVLLSRAPARLSFNPHSDHQGSFVLYGCHAREIVLVVGWRDDGEFHLANAAPEFASGQVFSIDSEIAVDRGAWQRGWTEYLDSALLKEMVGRYKDRYHRAAGRTGTVNYVKGAVLRLAHRRPGELDHGLNLLVAGDIPYGAGQSSSSAIVVATALAVNAVYRLDIDRKALVRLLGEAEWYVGTRGGAGDQAAMLLGERGRLTNLQFIPPVTFRDLREVIFPDQYQVLIVNSGVRAEKSTAEKRRFNLGVFAYKFAYHEMQRTLIEKQQAWGIPNEIVEGTHWLADFNTDRLSLDRIYALLRELPENCSLREIQQRYPDLFEQLATSFFDTSDLQQLPDSVPLRGAAMYGVGRADRGMVQDQLLARGTEPDMVEFGLLTSITHDGDRMFQRQPSGEMVPYQAYRDRLTDQALDDLMAVASQGPSAAGWEAAQLRRQPGFYGASVEQLDLIVDLVQPLEGVLGAGLMGAGGGGVVLVVARRGEALESRIRQVLTTGYFEPNGMAPEIEKWKSTAGAGVLNLPPD